jgi:hypothetical protein
VSAPCAGGRRFAAAALAAALPIAAALVAAPTPAAAQDDVPRAAPVGEMKPLGRERFQIGRIVVDRKARRFTVPGRVHVVGQPLEYLVTSPGGMKEYETLLEADATGSEFNLACILLGLERDPAQAPVQRFGMGALVGPRVAIRIAWQDGTRRREVTAAEALLPPTAEVRPADVEWVYLGSLQNPADGRFAADATGTLVGFTHDPNSVVEAVRGLGVGAYGSVAGNAAVLPPRGTPVEIVVEAVGAARRGAPR